MILVLSGASTAAADSHPLTIDDVLQTQSIGRVHLAAGDQRVIFEWMPPYERAPNTGTLASMNDRSALGNLWSIPADGQGRPRRLFPQIAGGGYWSGGPSPDGSRLAVYSLVDGEVRAGVFDLPSDRLTWFSLTPNYFWLHQAPVWISNEELVYPVLPEGELPSIAFRSGLARRLGELWRKSFDGVEPSATVLESSTPNPSDDGAPRAGALVIVNAISGAMAKLSDGYFYNLRLSPDGRFLAALRESGRVQHGADGLLLGATEQVRREVVIFNVSKRMRVWSCQPCKVTLGSIEWSADSTKVIYFSATGPGGAGFEVYSVATGSLARANTTGLRLACSAYFPRPERAIAIEDAVIVRGRHSSGPATHSFSPGTCEREQRYDWFVVRESAAPTNLTASFADPGPLLGLASDALFLLADGDVWRVSASGERRRVTSGVGEKLAPWDPGIEGATYQDEIRYVGRALSGSSVVLKTSTRVVQLDLGSGNYFFTKKPHPDAELVAVSTLGRRFVFRRDSQHGVRLTARTGNATPAVLLEVNQHYRDVLPDKQARFTYEFRNQQVSGCALLPPGWKRERRYPTIVYVYPNRRGACIVRPIWALQTSNNAHLFAARDYVVLFPNTSRELIRTIDGPTGNLPEAVLAAVDQAIREGYVDPNRLGLFGFSQGHHSVLQVLTRTKRFRAAIASHGISDFVSQYLSMPLYTRMGRDSFSIGNPMRFEDPASDNHVGAKPWEDPERYVRNSPIYDVEAIETPLLLIHSDFDQFPLGQSEEIFSALYRLRKRATYVTYWGEGHGNFSPANIRDVWQRMLDWYERYL